VRGWRGELLKREGPVYEGERERRREGCAERRVTSHSVFSWSVCDLLLWPSAPALCSVQPVWRNSCPVTCSLAPSLPQSACSVLVFVCGKLMQRTCLKVLSAFAPVWSTLLDGVLGEVAWGLGCADLKSVSMTLMLPWRRHLKWRAEARRRLAQVVETWRPAVATCWELFSPAYCDSWVSEICWRLETIPETRWRTILWLFSRTCG